jgi:phospholipase D1/2
MRPAPIPNPDEDGPEDSGYQSYGQDRNKSDDERKYDLVKDPLSDESQALWNDTARKNRDAYTAVFQPIPNDIVRNWTMYKVGCSPRLHGMLTDDAVLSYQSYVPNIKTGHIANPDMPLDRIKERLSEIRGHIVEAPVEFLIEEKGLVTGVTWLVPFRTTATQPPADAVHVSPQGGLQPNSAPIHLSALFPL